MRVRVDTTHTRDDWLEWENKQIATKESFSSIEKGTFASPTRVFVVNYHSPILHSHNKIFITISFSKARFSISLILTHSVG